jgi:hypothetical protein
MKSTQSLTNKQKKQTNKRTKTASTVLHISYFFQTKNTMNLAILKKCYTYEPEQKGKK